MRREIVLHGPLKEKYGERFELEVSTAAEAFRALAANFRGFEQDIRAGEFQIIRGPLEENRDTSLEDLTLGLGQAREMHIIPVIGGAKRGGGGKAVIGALIMIAAIAAAPWTGGTSMGAALSFEAATGVAAVGVPGVVSGGGLAASTGIGIFGTTITYGNIAMFGLSMAIGGVMQMLSPQPKAQNFEPVDRKPSFLFTGAVNASAQGNAVPLVYGRIRTGSVVVSAGVEAIAIS